MNNQNKIIVIGAGPAGLTAAYLLAQNKYCVTVLESDEQYVGGISRTVRYKGFYFDIGGHRFFSKSKEVENFWNQILKSLHGSGSKILFTKHFKRSMIITIH